jgi:glycerophosphoryl diester phosphodiesterase
MEETLIGRKHVITHRGLDPDIPNSPSESSYEAFKSQLARGFGGLEFDPNPTKDGIIILHDADFSRPTGGKDTRKVIDITTEEALQVPLANGRLTTFDELMGLIKNSDSTVNALHLKARFQTPEMLERIMDALSNHQDVFPKLLVFDVKANTAKTLKNKFPKLRLAPSIAHPYDIERYGGSIGNTLLSLEEVLDLRKDGLVDGIWGDEWDTQGENETSKLLYTPDFFEKVRNAGMFAALVTPELHGTSPGLYGGESHADAKDIPMLMKRIKEIKLAGADYFCTDHPDAVAKL